MTPTPRLTPEEQRVVVPYSAKGLPVQVRPLPNRFWTGTASVPYVLLALSGIGFAVRNFWNPHLLVPISIALQLLATVLIFGIFRGRRSTITSITPAQRRLESARCFLCPSCHYDLNGGDDEGQCPGCGKAYVRAQVVEAWRAAYLIERTFPHSASDRPMTQKTRGEAERAT